MDLLFYDVETDELMIVRIMNGFDCNSYTLILPNNLRDKINKICPLESKYPSNNKDADAIFEHLTFIGNVGP